MDIEQIASAIENNVYAGLSGLNNSNIAMSIDQLEDEVVALRESIILEYWKKGILQRGDLLTALNCVVVDCKDPTKCSACDRPYNGSMGRSELHFEIPPTVTGIGEDSIFFVGSADRTVQYKVYYSPVEAKYHKYHRRTANKPYVYIDQTLNEHGMYDGWVFNLPFAKMITVIGIFKDPRQLQKLGCDGNCEKAGSETGSITHEIITRLTKEKIYYYRQLWMPPQPNNQIAR